MSHKAIKKVEAKQLLISKVQEGQRIDNFLLRYFGNIPRSRIYQMLRKGEVRVNRGRIKQTYRLVADDTVRIPPIYIEEVNKSIPTPAFQQRIRETIIFEDNNLLVINKPAGIVVHSGSAQSHGVIEAFRAMGGEYQELELVHRLDKDTSGCLILAKNISVLRQLHQDLKQDKIKKTYMALLSGRIKRKKWQVDVPLMKNVSRGGERVVTVEEGGKTAQTVFRKQRLYEEATLVDIELITGRTHQIRVHSASIGYPVLGDKKYGDRKINQHFRKLGLKRMFLHAHSLTFKSPGSGKKLQIKAPLETNLLNLLQILEKR